MEPSAGFRLVIEATVAPSEDPEKVLKALTNVVGASAFNAYPQLGSIKVRSDDPTSLRELRDQLRDRGVRAAARRLCERRRQGNKVQLMLNRQAAFQGVLVLCSTESESPLGPIQLTISSDRLDQVIQWLTDYETG